MFGLILQLQLLSYHDFTQKPVNHLNVCTSLDFHDCVYKFTIKTNQYVTDIMTEPLWGPPFVKHSDYAL